MQIKYCVKLPLLNLCHQVMLLTLAELYNEDSDTINHHGFQRNVGELKKMNDAEMVHVLKCVFEVLQDFLQKRTIKVMGGWTVYEVVKFFGRFPHVNDVY